MDYQLECNDKVFNFEGWTYEKIPQLVWDGVFDYARIFWRKTPSKLLKKPLMLILRNLGLATSQITKLRNH